MADKKYTTTTDELEKVERTVYNEVWYCTKLI